MTEKTPSPQVWPTFGATDARALIRFLTEAFGFTETVVYGDGDTVQHAELAWPEGGGIMLGSSDGTGKLTPPGSFSAYVVTADPDGVYARAKAAGARITDEPHDTDYGSRDFTALDIEGNRWFFGSYPVGSYTVTLCGRSGPQRHRTRFWSSAMAPLAKLGARAPAQPSASRRRTMPQEAGSRPAMSASAQAQARSSSATPYSARAASVRRSAMSSQSTS